MSESKPSAQGIEGSQAEQWKLASVQLLGHLQRLGVHFLPKSMGDPREMFPDWVLETPPGAKSPGAKSLVGQLPGGQSHSGQSHSGQSHSGQSHSGQSHSGQSHSGLLQGKGATDSPAGAPPVPVAGAVPVAVAGAGNASSKDSQSATSGSSLGANRSASSVPVRQQPAPLFTRSAKTVAQIQVEPTAWTQASLPVLDRNASLETLVQRVGECRLCSNIVCQREKPVFGAGPANARIVLVGEAPGAEEDRSGVPFVGEAGKLLDKILAASGIQREQVYIMNTLKCRPPVNRTPTEAEMENCRPFFEAQLEVLQPDYIICWGVVAMKAVLGTNEPIGRVRGRFYRYHQAKVLVTYHPSYLLRTPEAKKETWLDMQMLMRDLGIPIPSSGATTGNGSVGNRPNKGSS